MPWVDPDAVMVPACLDIKCDKCGAIEHADVAKEILDYWSDNIFFGRHKQDFHHQTFCKRCAILLTPYVYRLRDIDELTMYVNKLKKAIHEKRTENNRSIAVNAGDSMQRRSKWGSGYRESREAAQIGEEHF